MSMAGLNVLLQLSLAGLLFRLQLCCNSSDLREPVENRHTRSLLHNGVIQLLTTILIMQTLARLE
jgi:hypothetical protein